jgi:hypothetical protein
MQSLFHKFFSIISTPAIFRWKQASYLFIISILVPFCLEVFFNPAWADSNSRDSQIVNGDIFNNATQVDPVIRKLSVNSEQSGVKLTPEPVELAFPNRTQSPPSSDTSSEKASDQAGRQCYDDFTVGHFLFLLLVLGIELIIGLIIIDCIFDYFVVASDFWITKKINDFFFS